jgi:hypothetical protein
MAQRYKPPPHSVKNLRPARPVGARQVAPTPVRQTLTPPPASPNASPITRQRWTDPVYANRVVGLSGGEAVDRAIFCAVKVVIRPGLCKEGSWVVRGEAVGRWNLLLWVSWWPTASPLRYLHKSEQSVRFWQNGLISVFLIAKICGWKGTAGKSDPHPGSWLHCCSCW